MVALTTFTAPQFIEVLKRRGIQISMDGKGRALDNVFIERFWRSLKHEEVYLNSYEDLDDARKRIGRYIDHYNTERPHASLEGRYPISEYLRLAS